MSKEMVLKTIFLAFIIVVV